MAALGLILLMFLSGCNYTIQKQIQPELPPISSFKPSELSFNNVYSKVLRASCMGCHDNGSAKVNLDTYSKIKENVAKVYQSTIVKRSMPKAPTSPLTSYQLGLLNAWIQSGMPEFSGPDTPPPPPPLEPTFESLKYHIFEPKCMACHAPGKPEADMPLVELKDFIDTPRDIVLPGNAKESGIILVVTGQMPDKFMPPAKFPSGEPTGFSKLTDKQIEVLWEWIDKGAKD